MNPKLSRRTLLGTLGSTLLLPAPTFGESTGPVDDGSTHFLHGVSSGDPDQESLVIWTRLSAVADTTQVGWELAADSDFTQILSRGSAIAAPARDYTVKVLVTGLPPGGLFYYRFTYAGEQSPVGRSRTLPTGDLEQLGIAVVSCSNYPFGYFNAYESIARDEQVQFVLHLGDYLYEYGPDGYGGETGRLLGREHQPPREIVTLADYRQRHAQYKADPQSRAMHAAHPLLAIWDDHESANNPWLGGAENHQPDKEGLWTARRDASLRAYFEWMPVRDPQPGHARSRYWRHWRFGSLASLVSLETRHSGRAEQIEYSDHRSSLVDASSAQAFMREVVGAADRPMLAPAMERFFSEAIEESLEAGRPWRLVANQIPMARVQHPRLADDDLVRIAAELPEQTADRLRELARMGTLGLPLYLDPWDGYPEARERLYRLSREQGAQDLLVLTGDSHSFWLNQLSDIAGNAMGFELGTTGITSPGDFVDFGTAGARLIDRQLAASNPEVLWTEGLTHGYLRLRLTSAQATADYVGVSSIGSRDYRETPLRRVRIAAASRTLKLLPE